MWFCFADDATQLHPTRPGMTGDGTTPDGLYAMGALMLEQDAVADAERALSGICAKTGFPPGRPGEFKWSPGRELWMRESLILGGREEFIRSVIETLRMAGAQMVLGVVDSRDPPLHQRTAPKDDVALTLVELLQGRLSRLGSRGVVISDRPGGDRADEDAFVRLLQPLVAAHTPPATPTSVALNAMPVNTEMHRLVQAADLITGCSLAYLSGEETYSPGPFAQFLPLYAADTGRRAGESVILHPEARYLNLYHWVFGDTDTTVSGTSSPLPDVGHPYSAGPKDPGTGSS